MPLKTLDTEKELPNDELLKRFKFQPELTASLDAVENNFNQNRINEILLWKVNRYALLSVKTLNMLNSISTDEIEIDDEKTRNVLRELLETKGIGLPVASTILRFKNQNIFQIIDKRVYRFLYGEKLRIPHNIDKQICLYLNYLSFLAQKCAEYSVPFKYSDRIIYQADKELNAGYKINY